MTHPTPQDGAPKKKRTGLIVGVASAAVVVVTFVITGFVTPGFLDSPPSAGKDIDAWADKLAAAFNERDTAAAIAMTCDKPPPVSAELVEMMAAGTVAEAAGTERDGDGYRVKIEFVDDETVDALYAGVTGSGDDLCWATTDVAVSD